MSMSRLLDKNRNCAETVRRKTDTKRAFARAASLVFEAVLLEDGAQGLLPGLPTKARESALPRKEEPR